MCRGLEGKSYMRCWVNLRGLVGLEERSVGTAEATAGDKSPVAKVRGLDFSGEK